MRKIDFSPQRKLQGAHQPIIHMWATRPRGHPCAQRAIGIGVQRDGSRVGNAEKITVSLPGMTSHGTSGGDAASGGDASGLIGYLEGGGRRQIADTVNVGGRDIEVISSLDSPGGATLSIRRYGEPPMEVGRLSLQKGIVTYEGAFTREIRTFFELKGWPMPSAFIIDARASQLPADEYMIAELKNYFGQKFGPQKAYTAKTRFIFPNARIEERFAEKVEKFFGENEHVQSVFASRWRPPGEKYSKLLGDYTTDANIARNQFRTPPVELRDLPKFPKLDDGDVAMRIVGLSPPGSRVAQTSHRIFSVEGRTIALEMPPYAYRDGVDVIAISHIHADHMNPQALARQLSINRELGIETKLLAGVSVRDDVADALLDAIEQDDSLDPIIQGKNIPQRQEMPPREYLMKRYGIRMESQAVIGDTVVEMIDSPAGVHGTPNAGMRLLKSGKPMFFYSGDGDFHPASMEREAREIMRTLELRAGAPSRAGDEALIEKYMHLPREDLEIQAHRLSNTYHALAETPYVAVDQGTSGLDTHGTSTTAEALTKERSEIDIHGRVEPTHNNGYGAKSEIPEIRENGVQIFKPTADGGFELISINNLEGELRMAGAAIAKPGAKAIEVSLDGTTVRLKAGPGARGAIKKLMELYSTTLPDGSQAFELSRTMVDGQPAIEWLKARDMEVKARPAAAATGSAKPKNPTHMGLSTELPPWVQKLGGSAKGKYEVCFEALHHAERFGVSPDTAEKIRHLLDSPSLFARLSAAIDGVPALSNLFAKAASAMRVAGKAFGPAFVALLIGFEAYERGDKLARGDATAWSETSGDLASAAAGVAAWAIDLPFAAASYGTRLLIDRDFGKAWDNVKGFAFPVTMATKWAVTGGLKWLHGVE